MIGPHRDSLDVECASSLKSLPSCEYDAGARTPILVLTGLIASLLFGFACIFFGLATYLQLPFIGATGSFHDHHLHLTMPFSTREVFLLILNSTFIKLVAWSTSCAHETALKWRLAAEKDLRTGRARLEFNTNLRFLLSSLQWWSANGLPANALMACCHALTYGCSAMLLLSRRTSDGTYNIVVSFIVLLILGITVVLQCTIALIAIWTTNIRTWSQSPLDTAYTMLKQGWLQHRPGRCMHSLYDRDWNGPIKPRRPQMSLWHSHPQTRTCVMYIWLLNAAGYFWWFIVWAMMLSGTQGNHYGVSWSPIPWSQTPSITPTNGSSHYPDTGSVNFAWTGETPTAGVLWGLGILVGIQGGIITTALTCTQSIITLVHDEVHWQEAGGAKGFKPPGMLERTFATWKPVWLYMSEPLFHWMFGLAVNVDASVGFQFRPVQILYLSIAGTLGTISITMAARRVSSAAQPSTYGHLQTLVDLIDEWPEEGKKMYWGHRSGGDTKSGNMETCDADGTPKSPYYAGTSEEALTAVLEGKYYGLAAKCPD